MTWAAKEALRDFPTDTLGHVVPVLIALSSSSLFVVSGAGLPIPVILATESIAQLCIAAYHQIGAYPARQAPWTEFRKRLFAPLLNPLANQAVRTDRWRDHMLGGVYDAALIALFQRQIHRRYEPVVPANYHVFYYVPPPAVLFDFNSDALLPYYCEPPHLVLNPHGVIDRRVMEHPDFEQWLRDAAIFGMPLPTSTWQWLPGPEPTVITRRPEYRIAERYFSVPGEFFLLIGYSFGRQRNGAIDDAESFEFLRELLLRFPRSIVIVDPNPEPVASLFEDALHQRIYACKLYWNFFAQAASAAMNEEPGVPNLCAVSRRVARLYDGLTR